MGGLQGQVDYFISYTSTDRAWAEWIAWQLKEAGSSVVLQAWDMVPGLDFLHEMQMATSTAKRTLAVLSPAYFTSQFSEAEWRVAFANDPSGEQRRLIPVRVIDFKPAGLLATRIYIDLVGKDRQAARAALLEGVQGQPAAVPTEEPAFPGEQPAGVEVFAPTQEEPRLPSALPPVWNVPHPQNRAFTGREELLEELAAGGGGGTATPITQAIVGLDGVGKTSLAVEYAYRQRAQLDVVWWLRAEESATLMGDFTGLASALALAEAAQPDQTRIVRGVHHWLADHDRWLLVFDNAHRPEDLTSLLPPAGNGQVLITSRWSAWGRWATVCRLEVLARQEAIALLRRHTGTQDERVASALAEALGDLPLALAEAAAYIDETQIGLEEYLELVRDRSVELSNLRHPAGSHQRVATVWSLSLDRVREEAPATEALLKLWAFLAPGDIPRNLPREHPEVLPEELRQLAGDALAYNDALRVLSRYSIATVTPATVSLHPLVQAVIHARMGREERQFAQAAVQLLDAAFPANSWELATWPVCKRLLPHVLAATEHAERLRVAVQQVGQVLTRASRYLRGQGEPGEARPLAERALSLAKDTLEPNDPQLGERYDELSLVLRDLGDYQPARQLLERALAIHQAAYGPDHPTMAAQHYNLGGVLRQLGDLAGARTHHERALAIDEAALGAQHPTVADDRRQLDRILQQLESQ
jgi:tetratricopeptide (TPR) repeat protein